MSQDLFGSAQSFDKSAVSKSIVESIKNEVSSYAYQLPPTLKIDKSLAVSGLHKSIRRGEVADAHMYMATILCSYPEYVYKRLGIIAYEEIGIAKNRICTYTIGLCTKSNKDIVQDIKLACFLVEKLAKANKSRAATDIFCLTLADPFGPNYLQSCLKTRVEHLVPIALDTSLTLTHRMTALRVISGYSIKGTNGYYKSLSKPRFDLLERICEEIDLPDPFKEMVLLGHNKTAGLNAAMLLAFELVMEATNAYQSDVKVESQLHNGINLAALDIYCSAGRAVIAKFVASSKPLQQFFTEHATKSPAKLIGTALFIIEGSLLTNEFHFIGSAEIKAEVEFMELVVAGIKTKDEASELIRLLKQEMPLLQQIRVDYIDSISSY
jgi:hypothetical protein